MFLPTYSSLLGNDNPPLRPGQVRDLAPQTGDGFSTEKIFLKIGAVRDQICRLICGNPREGGLTVPVVVGESIVRHGPDEFPRIVDVVPFQEDGEGTGDDFLCQILRILVGSAPFQGKSVDGLQIFFRDALCVRSVHAVLSFGVL